MRIMGQVCILFLVGTLFAFTGCASKTKKDVKVLQAQVGTITDEMVRLDQSLQETKSALDAEQNKYNDLQGQLGRSGARLSSLKEEEIVIRGIYRTPSGFQLPSNQIQEALKNAGYYHGNLDGKIGPQTRSAIEAFQKDNGLESDGVVGRKTWEKLKTYLKNVK